jgi:hypothetical protein
MKSENQEINLFSLAFHTSFFLPLLFRKLSFRRKAGGVSAAEAPFEYLILAFAALGCMVFGVVLYRAPAGMVLGAAGALVFFAMLGKSAQNFRQTHPEPTWEEFRPVPFLFLVLSGITVGLVLSVSTGGAGIGGKAAGAGCGLLAGYLAGIPAGFWAQSLGWMRTVVEAALAPLIIGLAVVSLVMALA